MNKDLHARLGHLSSGVIKNFRADPWSHQITLHIEVSPGGHTEPYELVFDHVAAFYYVADEGDRRRDPRNIDLADAGILEASEITYMGDHPPLIKVVRAFKEALPDWPSTPNFYVEMHSSVLMIEADSVTINGQRFSLGYPH